MKKQFFLYSHTWIMLLTCIMSFMSCNSTQKVSYFQDVNTLKSQSIRQEYEALIYKDDLLAIMVNSKDNELALPFNMPLVSYQVGANTNITQQRILGYLVDSEGYIDFPILGKLKVEGMTRIALTNMIKSRLISENLILDPIVTVQFLNFKISVMGEVAKPGTFTITGDRITLLEALSMTGDLTIYGRRDKVVVIREEEGKRTMLYHDLRSTDLFQSPYYYLQQNDIVYVEPNKTRAGQSRINQNTSVAVWLSAISILASIAALIVNITK